MYLVCYPYVTIELYTVDPAPYPAVSRARWAERTWASGITSLVRLGGWAVAPFAAGFLMQGVALATPLVVGAGMKIGYDFLLWRSFRGLKPPEE